MPPTDLTPERRRELVLAAIDRIKHFERLNIKVQMDPRTDTGERNTQLLAFNNAEAEFAWQWRNVEVLLRG